MDPGHALMAGSIMMAGGGLQVLLTILREKLGWIFYIASGLLTVGLFLLESFFQLDWTVWIGTVGFQLIGTGVGSARSGKTGRGGLFVIIGALLLLPAIFSLLLLPSLR